MIPKRSPKDTTFALIFRLGFVQFFVNFRLPAARPFRGSAGVGFPPGNEVKQAKPRKVAIPCGSGANLQRADFGTLVRSYSKE